MHRQFKMAGVTDTHMKHRMAIEFLTAEEVSPIEIHRHLKSVYGEHTADMSVVGCWVRHFKSGETETADKT
jgi:saccharopine dehydrogenase-like NADP-dependent oxidoreductase